MRYLFLCPDSRSASGGVAVIYNTVKVLIDAGYDAQLVHNAPDAGHPDYLIDIPICYTPQVHKIARRWAGRRHRLMGALTDLMPKARPAKALPLLQLAPSDVIVVPEFLTAEALLAFPDNRVIVYAQNPFAYLRSHARAVEAGVDPVARVSWFLGISDVNRDAYDLVGASPTSYFTVNPELQLFPFQKDKKPLISYMPRKRPEEAVFIDRALCRRGLIGDYDLVAIDGMTRAEVAEVLKDTRIFISLLRTEALGFPAAEAMAAGCITVGYTGLGTREYFDETTGIEVTEGDTFGVVKAVEAAVAEYAQSPDRLDAMRAHASKRIHDNYNATTFQTQLRAAWQEIDQTLNAV